MNATATQNNVDTLLEDIRQGWDQVRALPNEVQTLKTQLLEARCLPAASIRSSARPPGDLSDCGLWTDDCGLPTLDLRLWTVLDPIRPHSTEPWAAFVLVPATGVSVDSAYT